MKKFFTFLLISYLVAGYLFGMEEKWEIEEQVEQSNVPSLKAQSAKTVAKELIKSNNLSILNRGFPVEINNSIAKELLKLRPDIRLYLFKVYLPKQPFKFQVDGQPLELVFSPDTNHIVALMSDKISIYDFKTGIKQMEQKEYTNLQENPYSISMADDIQIAIVENNKVNISSIKEHSERVKEITHDSTIDSIDFNPAGNMLAIGSIIGAATGVVYLYDLANLDNTPFKLKKEHIGSINKVIFSPNGTFLLTIGHLDTCAYLYKIENSEVTLINLQQEFQEDQIRSAAFSNDNTLLAIIQGKSVVVYNSADPNHITRIVHLQDSNYHLLNVAFSPAGTFMVTGDIAGNVYLYDVMNPNNIKHITTFEDFHSVSSLAFSSDGNYFAVANFCNSMVSIYDLNAINRKLQNITLENIVSTDKGWSLPKIAVGIAAAGIASITLYKILKK